MQDLVDKLRNLQIETNKVDEACWDHIYDAYDISEGMTDILEAVFENLHEFNSTEAAMSVVTKVLENAQQKKKKHHRRNHGENNKWTT